MISCHSLLGLIRSKKHMFSFPLSPVKPNPPEEVVVNVTEDKDWPFLQVSWKPPKMADTRSGWITLIYEVRLKLENENKWEVSKPLPVRWNGLVSWAFVFQMWNFAFSSMSENSLICHKARVWCSNPNTTPKIYIDGYNLLTSPDAYVLVFHFQELSAGQRKIFKIYSLRSGGAYDVQVRCKPDHGFWSEWSPTTRVKVPECKSFTHK